MVAARRSRVLPVYPSRSEVHRIMAACVNPRDRMLLSLLWHTGGRVSEVLQIRVADITAAGVKMPNLKQSVPAQKHVFLDPAFLSELRGYCRGRQLQDTIISRLDNSRPIGRKRAWQIVTRTGATAGVLVKRFREERLRPPWCHTFRHGMAVHLLESGVPISAVQGQLGHSSLSSTQVYTALTDAHRQQLIAKVEF